MTERLLPLKPFTLENQSFQSSNIMMLTSKTILKTGNLNQNSLFPLVKDHLLKKISETLWSWIVILQIIAMRK